MYQVEGVGSIQSLSQPLVTAWPGSVTTALLLWWTALRPPGKTKDAEFGLSAFFAHVRSPFVSCEEDDARKGENAVK